MTKGVMMEKKEDVLINVRIAGRGKIRPPGLELSDHNQPEYS
jgi:hypothetical protein